MSRNHSLSERGQSIVIIALLMFVLIGISALVLDGGLGYANRRQAQNAADAAALAGADVLCGGGSEADARAMAKDYVVQNEGLLPDDADIVIYDGDITVTANVTHPTFFAGIFGSEDIVASADATAGCFVPCTAHMMPVAWSCHPPAGEEMEDQCAIVYGDEDDADPPLYVIMDSDKVGDDILCNDPADETPDPALLNCDVNPEDGIIDVLHGGERSWLDLDGGTDNSSVQLVDFINGMDNYTVDFPTWFSSVEGNKVNAYDAAEALVGQIVFVPVFDRLCEDHDPRTVNFCPYDAGDIFPGEPGFPTYDPADPDETDTSDNDTHFRVINISAFRITCIQEPSGAFTMSGFIKKGTCPGIQEVYDQNEDIISNGDQQSMYSIEGYFLKDYGGSGACTGPNLGVYTVYLK